ITNRRPCASRSPPGPTRCRTRARPKEAERPRTRARPRDGFGHGTPRPARAPDRATPARAPRVKICGITDLADAELAAELGAWALGMIFFDGSPRRCSPEQAERIGVALRREVELCGVFVNAPLERVIAASEDLGLTLLQLHGDEGPS